MYSQNVNQVTSNTFSQQDMSTVDLPTNGRQRCSLSSSFRETDHQDGKRHLLLAATGSVATIKLPLIVAAFRDRAEVSIRIIVSHYAARFLAGQSAEQPALELLGAESAVDGIYHDEDEWDPAWTRGRSILHIELRRWADVLVIAPLSANSLAKMVGGFCDNLLLSVVRAWDTTGALDPFGRGRKKRIIVAPAMNTAMWQHPVTAQQIKVLEEWGVDEEGDGWVEVLRPIEKTLACGDVGVGAMADWKQIVRVIEQNLGLEPANLRS
ncbi:MAG: hypothetical protein M1826_005702 [Phylliscum demangeonii]|nr:MAG: hypothetical protein M1826_005702 [Phylliscum demangeonii]